MSSSPMQIQLSKRLESSSSSMANMNLQIWMNLSSIMSRPLPVALKNLWLTRNTKEGLKSLSVSLDHVFAKLWCRARLAGKELDDYLIANPNKSIYCFSLNRKRPGHFNLVFKANRDSPTQTWVCSISTLNSQPHFKPARPSCPRGILLVWDHGAECARALWCIQI